MPFPFFKLWGWILLSAFLELWRRWCWSLIKIENENINNFEKYRDITEIPFYDDV